MRVESLWDAQDDLPENARIEVITLLNEQLADALHLQLQAKQAYWNVKGPGFVALQELFDEVEQQLEEYADEIAERAVALGGTAYPLHISAGPDHIAALSAALAHFARSTRAAIDAASVLGDADTADLFSGVSRGLDKLLWKMEAHNA